MYIKHRIYNQNAQQYIIKYYSKTMDSKFMDSKFMDSKTMDSKLTNSKLMDSKFMDSSVIFEQLIDACNKNNIKQATI